MISLNWYNIIKLVWYHYETKLLPQKRQDNHSNWRPRNGHSIV